MQNTHSYRPVSGLFQRRFLASAIAGITLAASTMVAHAELEEVIVTAQKKQDNLQDVAVAVSAFSSETIKNAGVLNIDDITAMTPGFSISNYNATTPAPYIRGVGTNSSSVGDDSSVGVFIDEVYSGRAGGYSADMFDIERIEVLRGPQGTLYGRNVAGGAMNIITKNPTEEFEGRVEASIGAYNLKTVKGVVSGALNDEGNLRGRLALTSRQRDGHVKNVISGNDLKDEDNITFRGKLAYEPSDDFALLITADYSEDDLKGPGARSVSGFGPTVPGSPSDKVSLLNDGFAKRKISGISAKLDYFFNDVTLTSVTAFRKNDYEFFDDMTGNWIGGALTNEAEEESRQFSQEFRLAGETGNLSYTVGAYFFYETVDRIETFDSSANAPTAPAGFSRPIWDAKNDSRSMSVFGEASWDLSERFTLIAGGRYTQDKKDFEVETKTPDLFGFLAESYSVKEDENWNEFSPKIGLEFKAADHTLIYASIAEGFKAGGFNGLAGRKVQAQTPFNPETVINYELGFKSEMLDRSLRLNVAAFYTDYEDLQNFFVDTTTFNVVTATADAEIKGVEVELWYSPIDGLDIFAAANLLKSEYTKFKSDPTVVGNNLQRAPEKTASLGIQYHWSVADTVTATIRGDYSYSDEMFFTTANSLIAGAKSYKLFNARAALEFDSGLELSLWGRNLGDEEYVVHSFTFGIGADAHPIYGNPRMWGLTAAYGF